MRLTACGEIAAAFNTAWFVHPNRTCSPSVLNSIVVKRLLPRQFVPSRYRADRVTADLPPASRPVETARQRGVRLPGVMATLSG